MHDRRWRLLLGIERLLLKTAAFFCVALIITQILMTGDRARSYLSLVDKLEGETIDAKQNKSEYVATQFDLLAAVNQYHPFRIHKRIRIHLVKPRLATAIKIVINGQVAGDFGQGECEVDLYLGDYLEIDARGFPEPAILNIEALDKGLLTPVNGLVVETHGTTTAVGKVKFK